MLTGLPLRRAILQTLKDYEAEGHETPIRQEDLAKRLQVELDRLDAHFVVLERSGYVSFLNMPGPGGHRMRFVTLTKEGDHYLSNAANFEAAKGPESPFKVIERSADERLHVEFPELRKYVETTDWVLDEEKPEILAKLGDLEKVVDSSKLDMGAVSGLQLWFERHKWLTPHVAALLKRKLGF